MQRAARPSRPRLPGAATSALLLGVQDDSSGKCLATAEPNQPSGLTATAVSSSQINLAWTADATPAPNQASYYDVERSPDGLGSWTSIGSTTSNSLSNTGLPASTQFYYRVTAYNCFGGSLASATANATTQAVAPTAPTGVSASASTTAVAVTVTWTDASSDETGFYVYRNTSNTTTGATLINSTGAGVQSYTDNSTNSGASAPAAGTTYYYWVSSFKSFDESTKTAASQNSSGGVSTLGIPAAPTGFTATANFADSVSLAWTDASTTETGFDIEVSTNAGSTYSSVTTTAANAVSYSHTGRLESTAYLYRIRATNAAGSSSWVVASSVTTPAAVQSFTATAASSTQINLSWTDKSGVETGFRIERSTDNTNWSLVTTTAANATSFSNTGLTASTLYYYRIRSNSYNGTNDSAWYTASATTQSGTTTYNVEYLVIAGGGAGGGWPGNVAVGGGGGAGGYRTATGFSLTVGQSYTVTVGAGGTAGDNTATSGNDSVFSTITSTKGGRGASYNGQNPETGGSGGGAASVSASTGAAGTSGQGNAGGNANTGGWGGPGGGGGASAVGANGGGNATQAGMIGGNGGAGTASSITGTSVTRAGGGGGGVWPTATAGTGGAGGGGSGGVGTTAGSAGSANTGGGGGGGGGGSGGWNSGNGGKGVVILRMATANYSGTTTGFPTVTTSGSDTILTFNDSGSYTA